MAGRRRQHSLSDCDRHALNNVDHLAFKYMMCKVESSTDSDSEISPRWSDTSTMGCLSSTPECETFQRTLPLMKKPAARHSCYSLFLDPYDGSSEDSDSNIDVSVQGSRRPRQPGGGGWSMGRSRRFILHHPASVMKNDMRDTTMEKQHIMDVQMNCGSDSELRGRDCADGNDSLAHTSPMDVHFHHQLSELGMPVSRSLTPGPVTPVDVALLPGSSSERSPSPCHLGSLYKRKLGLPGAEVLDLGQRKKQCVVNMVDEEQEQGDSVSEV